MAEDITITLTPKEAELIWIAIEDLQSACTAAVETDCVEILNGVCKKLSSAEEK